VLVQAVQAAEKILVVCRALHISKLTVQALALGQIRPSFRFTFGAHRLAKVSEREGDSVALPDGPCRCEGLGEEKARLTGVAAVK